MKIFQRLLGKKFLEPKIYDRLKSAADSVGGVGAGFLTEYGTNIPLCLFGYAYMLDEGKTTLLEMSYKAGTVIFELHRLGISPLDNDDAVLKINQRRGHWIDTSARVPFEDLMTEFKVVRG